ncbi:MAG: ATP-binding protein [Actinomycetes bacterium]
MRQRWDQVKNFIGPYRYNPGLLIGIIFVLTAVRIRSTIYLDARGYPRIHSFVVGLVIITILSIPVYLCLRLSNKFWESRIKSRTYYLIEITTSIFLWNLWEYLAARTLIPLLKMRDFLFIDNFIGTFIMRLVLGVFLVALTHSRSRDLEVELLETEEINKALTERYSALIKTDEEIRDHAAKLLHDRIQSELMLAAARLTKTSQGLSPDAAAEILPVIKVLEKIRGTDIRQVSQLLTPNLAGEGLIGACETLCENFNTAIEITLDISNRVESIDENTKLGIYRIIEQGLTNSIKHGPAENVSISVQFKEPGLLEVVIADDGPGSATPSSGKGTQIIDAWVGILGGSKEVESVPGSGYTMRVSLPLA